MQGQFNSTLARQGAGKKFQFDVPPEYQNIEDVEIPAVITMPEPADNNWTIGINLSFPLFQGGEKFATRQKAVKELNQLRLERDAIAERIEQRMRSALHLAGAALASIKQAKLAAEAADKSLNVVLDSYAQGLVSIVVLLDAQSAALVTDLTAANAIYDFLIDLMEVERAFGGFSFFTSIKEREIYFNDIDAYFEKMGMVIE